ncbi:MAG: hypothetical protein Q4G24_07725 [Paracoccus sp. (in: a-proteobacteria)]|nr:hypothetical protein [Paracoccus sp. (in: a-proteobacteria)]MDO5621342.1 hypothetical protein [Paracoccus sp. (in: a-proteobacteria)]
MKKTFTATPEIKTILFKSYLFGGFPKAAVLHMQNRVKGRGTAPASMKE